MPAMVEAAFKRLLEVSRIRDAHVYIGRHANCQVDTSLPAHDALVERDFIRDIQVSDRCLNTDLVLKMSSGASVGISLSVYGAKFEQGKPLRDNGPMRLTASINDLARSLWEKVRKSHREMPFVSEEYSTAIKDCQDLFIRFTGADRGAEPCVERAAMFVEYGWPVPPACSMTLHGAVDEFTKDFALAYIGYRYGIAMYDMLSVDLSELMRAVDAKTGPYQELPFDQRAMPYRQFGEDMIRFLESLTLPAVTGLLQLSRQDIRNRLDALNLSGQEIDYYLLEGQSLMLAAPPLCSLLPVYEAFYLMA
jgi:hypothetical protein